MSHDVVCVCQALAAATVAREDSLTCFFDPTMLPMLYVHPSRTLGDTPLPSLSTVLLRVSPCVCVCLL